MSKKIKEVCYAADSEPGRVIFKENSMADGKRDAVLVIPEGCYEGGDGFTLSCKQLKALAARLVDLADKIETKQG